MENYYQILEIRNDANISEIKLAYKKMVHKYHPDINKELHNGERFKLVIKAYKTLSDPIKRLEYDKELYRDNRIKNEDKQFSKIIKATDNKQKELKVIIQKVFDKKRFENFFANIKKARADLKRKKFIEREKAKLIIDEDYDFFQELTDIEMIARLRASSNYMVRAHAAKLIGKRKDTKYFFDLVKSLSDVSFIVRKEVVKSLGIMKDHRGINFLVNAIYDYEVEVRYEIAKVLRNFDDPRCVDALLKLINDRDERVVVEAVYSLGVIGDYDVIPEIRKLVTSQSSVVRKATIEVIKMLR